MNKKCEAFFCELLYDFNIITGSVWLMGHGCLVGLKLGNTHLMNQDKPGMSENKVENKCRWQETELQQKNTLPN